jgi:2-polyprenyl-6-methoxyphenol hydroxylase-like FAD-dependent oxidoreductase
MRAVVVGGGIGGLAAAGALKRVGCEATVVERAQALEAVGAGIEYQLPELGQAQG